MPPKPRTKRGRSPKKLFQRETFASFDDVKEEIEKRHHEYREKRLASEAEQKPNTKNPSSDFLAGIAPPPPKRAALFTRLPTPLPQRPLTHPSLPPSAVDLIQVHEAPDPQITLGSSPPPAIPRPLSQPQIDLSNSPPPAIPPSPPIVSSAVVPLVIPPRSPTPPRSISPLVPPRPLSPVVPARSISPLVPARPLSPVVPLEVSRPACNVEALTQLGSLAEYCKTLPDNFHQSVTQSLVEDIQAYEKNPEHPVRVVLLHGAYGVGKSFIAERACQQAEFESVLVDCSSPHLDTLMESAFEGPPDRMRAMLKGKPIRQTRVAVVDAIDEYDKGVVDKLFGYLSKVMRLETKTEAKKPPKSKGAKSGIVPLATRPNFVIIIAANLYQPNLSRWWFKFHPKPAAAAAGKSGPRGPRGFRGKSGKPESRHEVKVTPIDYSQTCTLVRKCLQKIGLPRITKDLDELITETIPNLNSLFSKVQFAATTVVLDSLPAEHKLGPEVFKADDPELSIFTCCQQLLVPRIESFDEYNRIWDRGGQRIDKIMFNSYPQYVRFTAAIDPEEKRPEDISPFIDGVESLASIAESFSRLDLVDQRDFDHEDGQMFTQSLRRLVKLQLEGDYVRAVHGPEIDIKHHEIPVGRPRAFAQCRIYSAEADKLHAVNMMEQFEHARKVKDVNNKAKLDDKYSLSKHVDSYVTRLDETKWTLLNIFPSLEQQVDEEGNTVIVSKKKRGKWQQPSSHPKTQAIEWFSHTYSI